MSDEVKLALIVGIPVLLTSLFTGVGTILTIILTWRSAQATAAVVAEKADKKLDLVHEVSNSRLTAALEANKLLEALNAKLTDQLAMRTEANFLPRGRK